MLFPHNQNWRTSRLPFSLALANSVTTGVSFNTPSHAIAQAQRWATRGMQGLGQSRGDYGRGVGMLNYGRGVRGYGPRIQYPGGSGMDGVGCGCGCGGDCGCGGGSDGTSLLCLAALVAGGFLLFGAHSNG